MQQTKKSVYAFIGSFIFLSVVFCQTGCSSAPPPIPYSSTRTLSKTSPTLLAIEEQIVQEKSKQDKIENQLLDVESRISQNSKDEKLVKEKQRLEKENELSQAELALLIGKHQLEAARILKKNDINAREKEIAKLNEKVVEKRKALAEVK
ncbi:MAG: hypothetical protein LDLANPLL_02664 [Turneriella sp.]|nr:hypothetical protein [Turneriella sp.]